MDLLDRLAAQRSGSFAPVALGGLLLDLAHHVVDAVLDLRGREVLPARQGVEDDDLLGQEERQPNRKAASTL